MLWTILWENKNVSSSGSVWKSYKFSLTFVCCITQQSWILEPELLFFTCLSSKQKVNYGHPECELPSWPGQGPNSGGFLSLLFLYQLKLYIACIYYNVLFLFWFRKRQATWQTRRAMLPYLPRNLAKRFNQVFYFLLQVYNYKWT